MYKLRTITVLKLILSIIVLFVILKKKIIVIIYL